LQPARLKAPVEARDDQPARVYVSASFRQAGHPLGQRAALDFRVLPSVESAPGAHVSGTASGRR